MLLLLLLLLLLRRGDTDNHTMFIPMSVLV